MDKTFGKVKSAASGALAVTGRELGGFAVAAAGFFMGRVVIFGDINPLGIAYLSTFFLGGASFYPAAIFTAAGILTKFSPANSLKYLICVAAMTALNIIYAKRAKNAPRLLRPIAAAAIAGLAGGTLAFVSDTGLYGVTIALLEAVLTFSTGFIMEAAAGIIRGKIRRKAFSNEELISLVVFASGIVAGSADIHIGEMSLRIFLCALISMFMARRGGAALGAASGAVMGFVLKLTGFEGVEAIAIFSLSGMAAGALSAVSKQLVAVGFVLGAVVMAFYVGPEALNSGFIFSLFFAGVSFILAPERYFGGLSRKLAPEASNQENYAEKMREITRDKLGSFSRAFRKLAKSFDTSAEKKTILNKKDIANLVDDAAVRICVKCDRCGLCWEDNILSTQQAVFAMMAACERKGRIDPRDLPDDFRKTCRQPRSFSEILERTYEAYRANMIYHNKLIESRALVSQQLNGASKIIDELSLELSLEITFKERLEAAVIAELAKEKIEVSRLFVIENKHGGIEVEFAHKPCYADRKSCEREIIPIVSRALGRKMRKDDKNCLITREKGKSVCRVRLVEERKFAMTSAVSRAVKDLSSESGDSYSFLELRNGQCMLALSDGMGSGPRAREESAAAVELLEEFIETGFDKETAVKLINSVLILKSAEENFSTLDICSINLYTGDAEFTKIGAAASFLLRDGAVTAIKACGLPVGIVDSVEPDVTRKTLKHGDLIVMATDGLCETGLSGERAGDGWLREYLERMEAKNPQTIADDLLDEAKALAGGRAVDDITVIVTRFWERKEETGNRK